MNFFIKTVSIVSLSLVFTACSSNTDTKQVQTFGIDNGAVLERAQKSIISMQEVLDTEGVKKPTDTHLQELADLMTTEMNESPSLNKKHIGVRLLKDYAFEGYEDANHNDIRDSGEAKLFKVELDSDNNRLMCSGRSESSGYTGMSMGGSFFAGMLMQRFLNRQRKAGVGSGFFNKRKVQSRLNYSDKRMAFLDKQKEQQRSYSSSGGSSYRTGSSHSGRSTRMARSSDAQRSSMAAARSRGGSRGRFRGK